MNLIQYGGLGMTKGKRKKIDTSFKLPMLRRRSRWAANIIAKKRNLEEKVSVFLSRCHPPLYCTPALLSFGWFSIGLPSDHTFIQEDDIEAIDAMGTLGIKSHHYDDTWVSIIFVQENVFNEYYSYVYILFAKDCSEKDPRGRYKPVLKMFSFILEQSMLTKLIYIWRFRILMVSKQGWERRIFGLCNMNVQMLLEPQKHTKELLQ